MKKNLIIIALFLALFGVSYYTIKLFFQDKENTARYAELLKTSGKNEIIKEYIRDSISHTVFIEKKVKDTEIEKRLAITNSYADSLERALKISIQKIDQALKVNAQLDAKLKMAVKDSAVTYRDKWLTIDYFPAREELYLKYNLNLNITRYNKRKSIFGRKQSYIDIFADDPRVRIKGLNSFTVQEKNQSKFGFGISTGYGFTINKNNVQAQPYVGIGLNYNLIHF